MKTHKLLIPIIALAVLGSSCSKNSTPAVGTTQAQEAFGNVNNSLAADISGLSASPGGVALASISSLTGTTGNPLGRVKSFRNPGDIKLALNASVTSFCRMLQKAASNERVSGTRFDFASKKGIYTWSRASRSFSKTGTSDIVKIDYPTDTTSNTNDAELKITIYEEIQIGTEWYPTHVEASVTVNQVEQASVKLTVGYDSFGDANKESIDLFVNPYTISLNYDNSQAASLTETFSFSKSGKLLIGTGFTVNYASAADKTSGNPPRTATGYVQLVNVRFIISVDGSKATTAQSIGDYVTITITVNGGVAGHVVWVADPQTGEEIPYVQYNDHTQTPLETVFADLQSQLNALGIG